MRLSPVVKPRLIFSVAAAALFFAAPAFAQNAYPNPYVGTSSRGTAYPNTYPNAAPSGYYAYQQQPGYYPAYPVVPGQAYPQPTQQQPVDRDELLKQLTELQAQQAEAEPTPATPAELGDPNDPNSAAYKVNKLTKQAIRDRADAATWSQGLSDIEKAKEETPPPDMQALQQINTYQANIGNSISDEEISTDMAVDMRRQAQKEAALSYGARGGLAKRNFEIMERMEGFDRALDRVFSFRALLIRAPSGLLIEPPIVKESERALVIADGGDEAAVADKVYDINKKAKIVSTARDWRQYLIQSWSEVPPPPRVLWPKTPEEQGEWNKWVSQGWAAGMEQADEIFDANVNQLVADYNGMVRYRMLLAQDMISAPYAMQEDRGVTGDDNQMRVGDSAVRITGPSQFLTKAELWKPADR
jgi:defect-in-organelle-trafficking protein DotC